MAKKSIIDEIRFNSLWLIAKLHLIKLENSPKPKTNNPVKPPEHVFMIPCNFVNKIMDHINPNSIINDRRVQQLLPGYGINGKVRLMKYFIFDKPLKRLVCNHNSLPINTSKDELDNILNQPCKCRSHFGNYIDPKLGHVCTSDYSILGNEQLKNIFEHGSNYRIDKPFQINKAKEAILQCCSMFIQKHASKFGFEQKQYVNFKLKILEMLDIRIKHLPNFISNDQTFNETSLKTQMEKFYQNFIFSPCDKVNSVIIIICKKAYCSLIAKEIGYENNYLSGNNTYIPTRITNAQIFDQFTSINQEYGIGTVDRKIPHLQATPKLHKPTFKMRYLASGRNCYNSKASKILQVSLKHIRLHLKNYATTIKRRTGKNLFWIIDSSNEAIDKLNRSSLLNTPATYDFSTLFTELKHDHIIQGIFFLIDIAFENAKKDFLKINFKYSSYNSNDGFHRNQIKSLLETIVTKSYINFCDMILYQKSGVGMGNSASSEIANLTLTAFEWKFVNSLEANQCALYSRSILLRYCDDLLVFGPINFDDDHKKIYPDTLKLNKSELINGSLPFLDIGIHGKNDFEIYDKRNDFTQQKLIFFFHSSSNISQNIISNIISNQIQRFTIICSKIEYVKKSINDLKQKLEVQDYPNTLIDQLIKKFIKNNQHLFFKFNLFSNKEIFKAIFK
jgi:hypothetical protein